MTAHIAHHNQRRKSSKEWTGEDEQKEKGNAEGSKFCLRQVAQPPSLGWLIRMEWACRTVIERSSLRVPLPGSYGRKYRLRASAGTQWVTVTGFHW
jgi:hypothetical protein